MDTINEEVQGYLFIEKDGNKNVTKIVSEFEASFSGLYDFLTE